MRRRFVSIWFRHLLADWLTRRQPELKDVPFVLAAKERGQMIITAANGIAEGSGAYVGMSVADARAISPGLEVFDDKPELAGKLLDAMAEWLIRYTPLVSVSGTDGVTLDVTGCAHLWGGEKPYLKEIVTRIRGYGYDARAAMADTVGASWAIARFGRDKPIIEPGSQKQALYPLSAACLRLEEVQLDKLGKLGMRRVADFASMPRAVLNKRFGKQLILRLDQAFGDIEEPINPKRPPEPYLERLPCVEPTATAEGIALALSKLLQKLCERLKSEQKGIRALVFECHRVDGKIEKVQIGTGKPSNNARRLFKLFENKLDGIEPALGIELFAIYAPSVDVIAPTQDEMLGKSTAVDEDFSDLIDRLANRIGQKALTRFLPQEHHWPERSIKRETDLAIEPETAWQIEKPRPVRLLSTPQAIEVTAPIPDYPPMMFRYRGKIHRVRKADGPERIEREWWLDKGPPRDYYRVEDEAGQRYWLFRSGHYSGDQPSKWFLHGFFA